MAIGVVQPAAGVSGARCAVMLVEDERETLEELSELLAARGFDVFATHSPLEAITLFERNPRIATIVTDLSLEGASGLDVIRTARQIAAASSRNCLFLLATGQHDLAPDVMDETRAGDVRLLRKPIMPEQLLSEIGRLCTGLRPVRQNDR